MTKVRVAINGFGRIGRNIVRAIYESGRKDIDVVAVNDLGPVETNAHLLQFDSVHGRFPHEVTVKGDSISIGSDQFKVTAIKDPSQLPWKDLGIDIALECTGIFTARDKAAAQAQPGAGAQAVTGHLAGATAPAQVDAGIQKIRPAQRYGSAPFHTTEVQAPGLTQSRRVNGCAQVIAVLHGPEQAQGQPTAQLGRVGL
jgi:glyceraldehyde 3-phosphate dehydrogenase